ncbi:hypothetical protein GCM10027517_03100 [Phycicoccus ginsengisoli]
MPEKTAVLYLRQSVTRRGAASVSLDVQEQKCRLWAESQGYAVTGVFADPDTSGSKNAPSERAGWRALRASEFDVVVIYRLDRLSRNFLQFWDTVKDLQADGRTLASVSESLDLGTGPGKMVASVLAVVAEMEADDISQRVADSRQRLIRDEGRAAGGKVPYGWRNVPVDPENPRAGKVLDQDPERIEWVRRMVERTQAGHSVYSTARWLTEQGAPTPAGRSATFQPSTVERILRHPVLAGMTPWNPGRVGERTRGADVLRDSSGLPKVNKELAVMSVADWREMVAALDRRDSPQARARSLCATTSALLSGLVLCGEHDEPARMWRGTTQARPGYSCPVQGCGQTITNFEDAVIEEFLRVKGADVRWRVVREVRTGGAAALPEIEARLDELDDLIRRAPDRAARMELQGQQANLLDLRDEKRAEAPAVTYRQEGPTRTFAEDWADAKTVEERRVVLDGALAGITVRRGRPGRRTREALMARLTIDWRETYGRSLGPPDDETLARWAEEDERLHGRVTVPVKARLHHPAPTLGEAPARRS